MSSTFHYGDTEAEQKKHLLLKSIAPLGSVSTFSYDNFGNPLTSQVQNAEENPSYFIRGETSYTDDGNYVAEQKDARGKIVRTETDPQRGTTTTVTDAKGQTVTYDYDNLRRIVKTSANVGAKEGIQTAHNEYTYDAKRGNLVEIRHNTDGNAANDVVYSFEQDALGRQTAVKVGNQTLSQSQYQNDPTKPNFGTLTATTYGNGAKVSSRYDDFNRVTGVVYGEETAPRYEYDYNAKGQVARVRDNLLNRTTFSAVKLGSKTLTSEYHFAAGGYGTGSVTNLVSSITQPGCNCGYGYDDNGNIASATLNGKWTGYTYDELGQLIQVNDHSDTRSGENGTTWKYTYDLGGNILKKERFAYADTTTPLETVTYEYGDANWRDKLTAVNGNAIAYDAIGNPLSDGTWTYTWQNGRQLQKMQKSGVTAEFVYNADGLRVQKTVNGVATKYTLHGKNIVHMTSGTDELHFFYDAQNRPAVVVYNGTAYAYVKSLQGDIVAILDENGNAVVSYGYDAWGAPLWCTGELAETLGKVQPFRYRGYVFDEETGLYYLRSRYYNTEVSRFLNVDNYPVRNRFEYADNSPICNVDYSGNETANAIGEIDWRSVEEGIRSFGIAITTLFNTPLEIALPSVSSISPFPFAITIAIGASVETTANDEIAWESIKATEEYEKFVNNLKEAKAKGNETTRKPTKQTNNHHIVPKADHRATKAQTVLGWVGIDCEKSKYNLVTISTQMHWFMHTNAYMDSINEILVAAYGLSDDERKKPAYVRSTLLLLRNVIEDIDQSTP